MIGVLSLVVTVALYTIELTWHSPPCGHGGLLALQLHVSGVLSSFFVQYFHVVAGYVGFHILGSGI